MKAWEISKDQGGLRNGSLAKLVCSLHKEAGIDLKHIKNANNHLVNKAIGLKVEHYFSLFNSIKENGFNKSLRPPIKAICKNGLYYLNKIKALKIIDTHMTHAKNNKLLFGKSKTTINTMPLMYSMN